jgi:hypothetical protein
MAGFLSAAALPQRALWVHDEQAGSSDLTCGDAQLPTTGAPVARLWSRTSTGAPEATLAVTVRFAQAADAQTATAGMAACRQGWATSGRVDDAPPTAPGDEAFHVTLGAERQVLVLRSGSAYLEATCTAQTYEDLEQVARDQLTAFQGEGRL